MMIRIALVVLISSSAFAQDPDAQTRMAIALGAISRTDGSAIAGPGETLTKPDGMGGRESMTLAEEIRFIEAYIHYRMAALYLYEIETSQVGGSPVLQTTLKNADGTDVRREQVAAIIQDMGKNYNVAPAVPAAATWSVANNAWNSPGHGLAVGHVVTFETTGTLPPPHQAATEYHVVAVVTNNFQVAESAGGDPITGIGPGTGTHTFQRHLRYDPAERDDVAEWLLTYTRKWFRDGKRQVIDRAAQRSAATAGDDAIADDDDLDPED